MSFLIIIVNIALISVYIDAGAELSTAAATLTFKTATANSGTWRVNILLKITKIALGNNMFTILPEL